MNPFHSSRRMFMFIVLVCVLMMGYALFAQYVQDYQPCMLCMVQRVFVCAIGLVALIAAVHGAGPTGTRIYGVLTALCAAGGMYVAGRHIYLQQLPPEALDGCAPSFEYALSNYDALKFLQTIFIRDQDCGKIDWTFLGMSMPTWTLMGFTGMLLLALWAGFNRRAGVVR